LQRIGLVLHMSPSRNLVIKTEKPPKIGETVVNDNLKPVGKVVDVFGPVTSPYASVKPTARDPKKLLNTTLYSIPSRGERRR
jgi:RNA-binding protein